MPLVDTVSTKSWELQHLQLRLRWHKMPQCSMSDYSLPPTRRPEDFADLSHEPR
jgi:hypothetical protein